MPGNRRHDRPRAGRDHEAAGRDLELDPLRADDDGLGVAEARLALDHADAKAGEALLGIVRRDRLDDAMDVVVDLGELDDRLRGLDAERPAGAKGLGALARRDHRLRRHAAGVEALAAHPALFDQHHRHAERGCGRRDRQSGGAAANDAEIGGELLGHATL